MSPKYLSRDSRRQVILYSLVIVVLYFLVFGYLSVRPFEQWALSAFFDSTIAVFMGAGTIGIITAIILVVQSIIEGEREKQQKVFDRKLELYNHIVDEMKRIYRLQDGESTPIIDDSERSELFFTQLKVLLLAKPDTLLSYSHLIKGMANTDGTLSDDASQLLVRFVAAARDDLEVQEKMNKKHEAVFEEAITITRAEAEGITRKGGVTYFDGEVPLEQYIAQVDGKVDDKLANVLRSVRDYLETEYKDRDGVSINCHPTAGLSCLANGKQRNAKFCGARFTNHDYGGGKIWAVEIFLLKSPANKYAVPKSDHFVTHQAFYRSEFFAAVVTRPEQFGQELKRLISESYSTRVSDRVTEIQMSRQECRKLAENDIASISSELLPLVSI